MKKVLAILLAAVMIFGLAACGGGSSSSSSAPAPASQPAQSSDSSSSSSSAPAAAPAAAAPAPAASDGSGIKVGISINATSNQHNLDVYETAIAECEKAGYEVIATNANGAAAQQAADIENLIENNCDVIVVSNGEAAALINVVARAKEKGIGVISYESGWIEGCDAMFGVNDFACASELYLKAAAAMGYEGEIITMHHNDHPVPRTHYFVMKAICEEYNISIVNDGYTGYPGTTELAYNICESALLANPNVKGIWASFDLEAIGALQACQALGREDIVIVGYDGDPEVLKNIKEGGQVIATANTGFKNACAKLAEVVGMLANGEKVERFYPIDYNIIDSENIDEFYQP